eukprot:g17158.t1
MHRHSYIQNSEDREEAGTPDIVGCIRAGLVYHLHTLLPEKLFEAELSGLQRLLERWSSNERIEVLGQSSSRSRAAIVSFMIRYGNAPGGLYLHYNFVVALLNDLFGIQARGGCACAGPYGQQLLGLDLPKSKAFDQALLHSAQEVLRPGFVRVGDWVANNGWRLLPAYSFCVETGEWHHRLSTPQQDREWLSALAPPVLQTSPLRDLENSLKHKEASPPQDLLAAADLALTTSFKGENPIPLSSTRCPLLDAEYAHLVWFALPTDAAHSLLMGEEEPHLAEGSIFTKARVPCSVQLSAAMDGISILVDAEPKVVEKIAASSDGYSFDPRSDLADGVLLYENDSLMALSEAEQASGASGFESTSLASMNGIIARDLIPHLCSFEAEALAEAAFPAAFFARAIPSCIRRRMDFRFLAVSLRVAKPLREAHQQACRKYSSRMFLHWYESYGFGAEDFAEAFETLETIITTYDSA